MQNIDPIYFIQPLVGTAFGIGIMVAWYLKRRYSRIVLPLTLVAYAGAIIAKEIVQAITYQGFVKIFGFVSPATGLYFGLQTVFFEVGGAYVVARYAISRGRMARRDAVPFGLGLSLWENAGLLGILSLINLTAVYFLLTTDTPIAQTVYSTISSAQPGLFYPPSQALPGVLLGTLERFSSFLTHVAFGYLCVVAAVYRRSWYLLVALPMGLIDALVPFASTVPLWVFELVIFVISAANVTIAWGITEGGTPRAVPSGEPIAESGWAPPPGA